MSRYSSQLSGLKNAFKAGAKDGSSNFWAKLLEVAGVAAIGLAIALATGGVAAVATLALPVTIGASISVFSGTVVAAYQAYRKGDVPAPGHKISNMSQIGDKIEDGTVYAGISPDTKKPMYAAPADAVIGDKPAQMTFGKARWFAKKFQMAGKNDFRVPTWRELEQLYQNKDKGALKGTFNDTSRGRAGWYTSSSTDHLLSTWQQSFRDGAPNFHDKFDLTSVRLVRG